MPNLEEAVVATLFDQSGEIADEIMHHNPLLAVLKDKGLIKKFSGGYEIRKPVMYNDTAVGGFYSDYQAFDLDSSIDFTAFRFGIKQVYEPVAISGRERRANRDEEQLLDLVETKIMAAKARLKNTVSTSLKGDGTGYSGREFDGLKKAVASSPSSGTYGGIDRSTNTWARNDTYSSGGLTAANIQGHLTQAIIDITRGDDSPDIGFAYNTQWKLLHDSLTAIQRINDSSGRGKAGFSSKVLTYDGVDFYFDGGVGGAVVESGSIRLLTSKYWSFDLDRQSDFKPLSPTMDRPVDQDAFFTVIIAEGNLCCSAPAFQAYVS